MATKSWDTDKSNRDRDMGYSEKYYLRSKV